MVKFPVCGPLGSTASLPVSLEVQISRPVAVTGSGISLLASRCGWILEFSASTSQITADAKFLQAAEGTNALLVP